MDHRCVSWRAGRAFRRGIERHRMVYRTDRLSELRTMFLECVGDVFQKDEAEDDMLICCRIHIVAELVGREP